MAQAGAGLKWGVERRLEFIEFRLFWEGGVNRADIIEMFDVSVPQASKDLTLYQERAPKNAIYDKSAKRYVASDQFQPCFLKPDPAAYLNQLRSVSEGILDRSHAWIGQSLPYDAAPTPVRGVNAADIAFGDFCNPAVGSHRGRYQSLPAPNLDGVGSPRTRSASTASDGTPAPFARRTGRSKISCSRGCWRRATRGPARHRQIPMRLARATSPSRSVRTPNCPKHRRRSSRLDYGMRGDKAKISVRRASALLHAEAPWP